MKRWSFSMSTTISVQSSRFAWVRSTFSCSYLPPVINQSIKKIRVVQVIYIIKIGQFGCLSVSWAHVIGLRVALAWPRPRRSVGQAQARTARRPICAGRARVQRGSYKSLHEPLSMRKVYWSSIMSGKERENRYSVGFQSLAERRQSRRWSHSVTPVMGKI